MPAGAQGVRLGRLLLGALLVLVVPALSRAAENTAVPPAVPPAPTGSLRDLLTAARADAPTRETIVKLKELIPTVADERLRERLTCAVAMGLRYGGDLAGFAQLSKELRTRYPESALLPLLEDDAFEGPCTVCDGRGETQRPCNNCGGKGTCTNSKCENGKIRYKGFTGMEEKPCPICKGTGKCPVCKGTGTLTEPCAACRGKGRRETKARDREVFLTALDRVQTALDLPAPSPTSPTGPTSPTSPTAPVPPPKDTPPDVGTGEPAGTATAPAPAPGSGKTPEYLLPLLKEYGAWLNVMQTRAGMPVAIRLHAEDDAGRAVLYVTVTRDLLRQPRDKRAQTFAALRGMWAEKVASRRFNGQRLAPATVFEDDAGKVVRDAG